MSSAAQISIYVSMDPPALKANPNSNPWSMTATVRPPKLPLAVCTAKIWGSSKSARFLAKMEESVILILARGDLMKRPMELCTCCLWLITNELSIKKKKNLTSSANAQKDILVICAKTCGLQGTVRLSVKMEVNVRLASGRGELRKGLTKKLCTSRLALTTTELSIKKKTSSANAQKDIMVICAKKIASTYRRNALCSARMMDTVQLRSLMTTIISTMITFTLSNNVFALSVFRDLYARMENSYALCSARMAASVQLV
jgi:hypothetical protein